uniref:Hypothetical conserved protein n=1 Tax=Glossina morsitans morsitans TaxID=37546 RepID=D3TQM0_GLOMM
MQSSKSLRIEFCDKILAAIDYFNLLSDHTKQLKIDKNCQQFDVFDLCKDCLNMSALPQGAFAACKLRDYEYDLTISRRRPNADNKEIENLSGNKKLMEYNPFKYNEKLMNSIWSIYNRYSPHNIKNNVFNDNDYEQQSKMTAVSQPIAYTTAAMGTINDQTSANDN